MVSTNHSAMANSNNLLPPEMWLKILSYSSGFDLYSCISPSCSYFNQLISFHQRLLPRIRVTLRVWVHDDNEKIIKSSLHPSINYAISMNDDTGSGRPKCQRKIDSRVKMMFVSFSGGKIKTELENREGNIESMDEQVLMRLLSWMEVTSLIVEVRKEGAEKSFRRFDNTLILIMQWTIANFGAVTIKNMSLSSHNSLFEWRLNERSIQLIESLSLESLIIENMPSIEILSSSSFSVLSVTLRMSHTHKRSTNRLLFHTMDRSYFERIFHFHSPIYHSLYSDVPSLVSMITAVDLADFILLWRISLHPLLIICLSFNSIVSLSDFRSIFPSKGLDHILEEIPYCRYRTKHTLNTKIGLELSCYGNGLSTQWQIRASNISLLV